MKKLIITLVGAFSFALGGADYDASACGGKERGTTTQGTGTTDSEDQTESL
jgi:hypothetical protein